MKKDDAFIELRKQAEKMLKDRSGEEAGPDVAELIHELEVRQAELELQNEEFRRSQVDLEVARRQYQDLYDFAPVGFVTLNSKGLITKFNRAAKEILAGSGGTLTGRGFSRLIHPQDHTLFYACLRKAADLEGIHTCEARIRRKDTYIRIGISAYSDEERDFGGWRMSLSDITERKRAEEALRNSLGELELRVRERTAKLHETEERLGIVVQASRLGTWDWSFITEEVTWNSYMYELLGRDSEAAPITGEIFFDYIHPEDKSRVLKNLDICLTEGDEFQDEFRAVREDGKVRWLASAGEVYRDSSGRPVRMAGINYDITERKQAEEALRESQRRLSAIFQSAEEAIITLDEEQRCLQANHAAGVITGVAHDQLIGRSLSEFVDPSFNLSSAWEDFLRSGRFKGEVPIRHSSGSLRIVEASGTANIGPGRHLFVGYDITERKRMEDELRKLRDELERRVQERTNELEQTNERLREENQERIRTEQSLRLEEARLDALLQLSQISEASLQEITSFVLEQAIRLTNSKIGFVGFLNEDESVYTLHAVSKDVVKECNVTGDPFQWHVVDAGIWAEAIREHRTLFVNDYSKPHPMKRGLPPGHLYVERFMVVPILEGERVIAVAGVGNKALEYNKSDERQIVLLLSGMCSCIEKNRSREELENAYKELEKSNFELAEYNRQLKALNQELQDFAFVASHDLNEPLRKIRAFGDLVTKSLADLKDEASKDYLKRMQTAAARMQSLLNSLLSYSRVTTMAEAMKKTDLRRSVKVALSNLEILIREKNADVEIGDLPTIKADVVQMTQLFQNLIGNALKFHREGEAPHVKIHSKEVGDDYEIYVEDKGIGFDEKYLDKIFLPFQRLHGRSSNYEGVGMGLAICRKIVQRHGGKITARSQLGKGSTFIVTLPRQSH